MRFFPDGTRPDPQPDLFRLYRLLHQANQLPEECSINIGTAQHWITRNYHYPLAVASLQDTAQAYNANGIAIRSGIRWRGCPASGIRGLRVFFVVFHVFIGCTGRPEYGEL